MQAQHFACRGGQWRGQDGAQRPYVAEVMIPARFVEVGRDGTGDQDHALYPVWEIHRHLELNRPAIRMTDHNEGAVMFF